MTTTDGFYNAIENASDALNQLAEEAQVSISYNLVHEIMCGVFFYCTKILLHINI